MSGGTVAGSRAPIVLENQTVSPAVHARLVQRTVRENDGAVEYKGTDAIAVDRAWKSLRKAGLHDSPDLVLDLRNVRYIAHNALLPLLAIVSSRNKRGLRTRFRVNPELDSTRYLQAWHFFASVAAVANVNVQDVVFQENGANPWIPPERNRMVQVIETPGGGTEELLSSRHFALYRIASLEEPSKAAALARENYLERQLMSVLDIYLQKQGLRLGTIIVEEAVRNAAMHAGASIAFTTSQFVGSPREFPGRPSHLSFGVWDDGESFAATLMAARRSGREITMPPYGTLKERFRIRLKRDVGQDQVKQLTERNAHSARNFPLLTVAAFMAGVTSKAITVDSRSAVSDRTQVPTEFQEEKLSIHRGGEGLAYIRKNVVDLFGGKIHYSTGHWRMSLSSSPHAPSGTYDVKLSYSPQENWHLDGNLLAVEIPLTTSHDLA